MNPATVDETQLHRGLRHDASEKPRDRLPDLAALFHAQPAMPRKTWLERHRGHVGVTLLAPLVVLASVSPARDSLMQTLLDCLGMAVFLAGAVCRFWAMLYIGGRKGRELVERGPYSLVRNPLYWGTLLMTLSLFVFLGSIVGAIGCSAVAAVYLHATVASEERRLAARHGAAFTQYCRRVPRYWPKLAGFTAGETVAVDLRCLAIEASRALAWGWIPVAAQVLITLRLQPCWPHLVWLP